MHSSFEWDLADPGRDLVHSSSDLADVRRGSSDPSSNPPILEGIALPYDTLNGERDLDDSKTLHSLNNLARVSH